MKSRRLVLCAAILLTVLVVQLIAQEQQGSSSVPTFQSTSSLVVLDVTVLDKRGRPVVNGLTKDDFTITEDKKPQRILTFEAPQVHVVDANARDDDSDRKAPLTIFVLDLLNSPFEDFAFIRYSTRQYLEAQPAQLNSPAELMVLSNDSLEVLQGYTRNRDDLLDALNHFPPALPYKLMMGGPDWVVERAFQSYDALQQIVLQNTAVPGRKNIVWVGHGAPSSDGLYKQRARLTISAGNQLEQYLHSTINMLLSARLSLFVIYPGLNAPHVVNSVDAMLSMPVAAKDSYADFGDDDPFEGGINFGVFVNETGGKLFYNRNDVDREIAESQQLGSEYYTVTHRPQEVKTGANFRRIRVTLRDRNLHVLTKPGYFALGRSAVPIRQQGMLGVAQAILSTDPYHALDLTVSGVVRHTDANTAEFTVQLKASVGWRPADNGNSTANAIVAALSRNIQGNILASKVDRVTLGSDTEDPIRLAQMVTSLPLTVPVPRKTQSVRVVVEVGGRIGSAEVDRQTLDAAPALPTPPISEPATPGRPAVRAGGERITVQQLEQVLAVAHGQPDAEIAQQLSWLELSERLSTTWLSTWQAQLPGPESQRALMALADASEFLDLPVSEISAKAAPDAAEQRRIIALALHYLINTIPQLPNFFATRVTTSFQDAPQTIISPYYEPLHPVHTSSDTVLYQDGREVVDSAGQKGKQSGAEAPLTTLGVFGPILGRVLVDGAGTLAWSHWEQGAAGPEAVLRCTVLKAKSHYEVSYCCIPGKGRKPVFQQFPGYHGEMAIDPVDGTILRVTLQADLKTRGPVVQADIMVEYGSMEIGGKTYICPLRSISLQMDSQPTAITDDDRQNAQDDLLQALLNAPETVQTSLNHVVFEQYHLFRSHARVLIPR
jgi:VWFA-related protein